MITTVDVGAIVARIIAIALVISTFSDFWGFYDIATLDDSFVLIYSVWGESIARMLLALLLWFLPRVCAAIVIPGSIRRKTLGDLNIASLEGAAFGLFGLYLVVWGLTDAVYHLFTLAASTNYDAIEQAKAGMLATIVELIVGVWLMSGRNGPRSWFRNLG